MPRIAELWLYPVKSLQGVRVETARVEPWGFAGDRRWMIVDRQGTFLTQRQLPGMAALRASLTDTGLRLSDASGASIAVETPSDHVEPVAVRIWRDQAWARPGPAEADAWLTARLGVPCRLVYQHDPFGRGVDLSFGRPEDRVSFADGFALLLTNEASLFDLHRHPSCAGTPMDRFRPNLVVTGAAPWAEDGWSAFKTNGVAFRIVKPCGRCIMVTTDQATGERAPDGEPLRTLASFRRDASGRIVFGQNVSPDGTGSISVGETLTVEAFGEPA